MKTGTSGLSGVADLGIPGFLQKTKTLLTHYVQNILIMHENFIRMFSYEVEAVGFKFKLPPKIKIEQ